MKLVPILLLLVCSTTLIHAQPVLETGGQTMPNEWIDKDTKHRVVRISRMEGNSNLSFYFHNNPFIGNKMVYYSSHKNDVSDLVKQETYSTNALNKQIYLLNLKNFASKQLTFHQSPMNGEIVDNKSGVVYYQIKDSVFSVDAKSLKSKLIFVFPSDFKAGVTTVNADGTLLAGSKADDKEKEILRKNPNKGSYFDLIYDAKLPKTLFTIDIKTGKLDKIFTDSAWLNHVQFSPTDPNLLMFCHEGPWHKVDRIHTIDIVSKEVKIMHKRTMPMEIAGHEWFAPDGKTIYFDLQQPRSIKFFLAGANVQTGEEVKYAMERNEWSIHFNCSTDQKLFCGDGGDAGQVAKAPDGRWIYLFTPKDNMLISTKLVNMKNHNYKLEPNVHFSPDGKWIIFRANFEKIENVYAVEIKESAL